jgi:hypothetical protein
MWTTAFQDDEVVNHGKNVYNRVKATEGKTKGVGLCEKRSAQLLRRPEKRAVSCSIVSNALSPQVYSGSTERRYSGGS